MKTISNLCIALALCFWMCFCAQIPGQQYNDGLGYLGQSQGQHPQAHWAFATNQPAQPTRYQPAQYPQAQPTQYQQVGYQPAQLAQSQLAQSQPAQSQPAQSQQAKIAQAQYSQALNQGHAVVAYQEPSRSAFQLSNSEVTSECFDCAVEEYSTRGRLAGVYAGYSFAFTKLYMKESFEAYVLDFTNNTQTLMPFDYDFKLTPRVWIGARNQRGVGARASYWNYDQSSNGFQFTNSSGAQIPVAVATSVIFPAAIAGAIPGDTLTVSSAVEASTLDLEGTYAATFGALETELAGGLRYARSEQTSVASIDRNAGFPSQPAQLNWRRKFDGTGPVFSANGKLPIGTRGFYGVGGVGLSFLFGEKTLQRAVQNDSTPFPNTGLPFLNFEKADEISGIYNVQIGLGRRRQTALGNAFLEGTYEGQLWTDLGAPTLTFAGFNSFNVNLGLEF